MNSKVTKAKKEDALTVAKLAIQMWEDNVLEELATELAELIGNSEAAVFLGTVDGQAIGFAQCQLRYDYVEGTETSPVGYLEGIFVEEKFRKQGYAKQLLAACENWAKEQGCTEFASDCELDNTGSLKFHLSLGFEEANRVICFTKPLGSENREVIEKKEESAVKKHISENATISMEELNNVYYRLEMKQTELFQGLFHRTFDLKRGYYNGNYHRDKSGKYVMEYFPIPIIEVQGFCDVEINLENITVSTKLTKQKAVEYNYDKLMGYSFEAYGVEDYLQDFYALGMTTEELQAAIKESEEKEIGFSFKFDFDITGTEMFEFVKMLRREGFYY